MAVNRNALDGNVVRFLHRNQRNQIAASRWRVRCFHKACRRRNRHRSRPIRGNQTDVVLAGPFDLHLFVISSGRNQDRVAGISRIDGILDRGKAAVSNEQEATCLNAIDNLDVVQRVGSLRTAGRDGPAAGAVCRDGAGRQAGQGIPGRIIAVAAKQAVVAAVSEQRIIADFRLKVAAGLVGAVELVIAISAVQLVIAALAYDAVILVGADDRLPDGILTVLIAWISVTMSPVPGKVME